MTRPMLLRCLCLAWLLTAGAGCKWTGTSFSANSNGAIPMLNFAFVPRQSEPPVLPSGVEKAPDPIRQVAHEEDGEEKVASKKTSSPPRLAGAELDENEDEDMLNLSDDEPEQAASKSKKKSRGNPLSSLFKGKKKAPRVPLPRTDSEDDDEDEPDPRDKLNM